MLLRYNPQGLFLLSEGFVTIRIGTEGHPRQLLALHRVASGVQRLSGRADGFAGFRLEIENGRPSKFAAKGRMSEGTLRRTEDRPFSSRRVRIAPQQARGRR